MADIGVTDLEKNAKNEPQNIQELTQYVSLRAELNLDDSSNSTIPVQSLLQNMQDKFQQISDQILNRIDDMGNRVDDLEKNIADLMTQAGAAPAPGFEPPTGAGH